MTPEKTRAWILLAVPKHGGDLPQLIGRADGLNKAIPTHAELTDSLGWLRAAELVTGDLTDLRRTDKGRELVDGLGRKSQHAFDLWDALAEALQQIAVADYRQENLSPDEVDAAHAAYSSEFWKLYKALEAKEKNTPAAGGNGMAEFIESIRIDAPIDRVWAVLADIGSIADWNPGVKESRQTTSGEVGTGAGRRCELGGRNYLDEEVVTFEPPDRITFRITATNLPFASADIRFELQAASNGTDVTVSPIYTLKMGAIGKLLDKLLVRSTYRKGMRDLLQGLKSHVESSSSD